MGEVLAFSRSRNGGSDHGQQGISMLFGRVGVKPEPLELIRCEQIKGLSALWRECCDAWDRDAVALTDGNQMPAGHP